MSPSFWNWVDAITASSATLFQVATRFALAADTNRLAGSSSAITIVATTNEFFFESVLTVRLLFSDGLSRAAWADALFGPWLLRRDRRAGTVTV
jgi:hypothetical protein